MAALPAAGIVMTVAVEVVEVIAAVAGEIFAAVGDDLPTSVTVTTMMRTTNS